MPVISQICAETGVLAFVLLTQPSDLYKIGEHALTIEYVIDYGRIISHPTTASVRFCRHQRDESESARRTTGRGGYGDGKSRWFDARAGNQKTGGGRAQPAQSPLLHVARHSAFAPGDCKTLPGKLRRRDRP